MIKWVLLGVGALLLYNYMTNQSRGRTLGSFGRSESESGSGLTGFVNSLTGLTRSITGLFGGPETRVTKVGENDLIAPSF